MGFGGAEEHTLGDDDCRAAADFQQCEEAREKQQLGLFRVGDFADSWVYPFGVKAASEGRVGEDDIVKLLLVGGEFAKGVAVGDVGLVETVHVAVHCGDADHGAVEVVAGEGVAVELLSCCRFVEFFFMCALHPFGSVDEETGGAAGGVDNFLPKLRCHEFDQQVDDVLWRTELAIRAGSGQLGKHVLIQVAGNVAVLNVEIINQLHRFPQRGGAIDPESGVLEKGGKCGGFAGGLCGSGGGFAGADSFQERENLSRDNAMQLLRIPDLHKVLPA